MLNTFLNLIVKEIIKLFNPAEKRRHIFIVGACHQSDFDLRLNLQGAGFFLHN